MNKKQKPLPESPKIHGMLVTNRMRLFFDHQIFTFQKFGGVSRYFFELMRNLPLSRTEHSALFLGIHGSSLDFSELKATYDDFVGLHVPNIRTTIKLRNLSDLWCERRLRVLQSNVYHMTYYTPIPAPDSVARIITIHDMIYERFPKQFGVTRNTIEKQQAILSADAIVCISHNTMQDLLEFYPQVESKCVVIHHGAPGAVKDTAESTRPTEHPFILHVGKRGGYKNFTVLARAFARLREHLPDLKLVCFGGTEFNGNEMQFFRALGITNDVLRIAGGDTALFGAYRHAECFVYPSKYEGFGLPLLESMKCACPVVTTSASCLPEIAGDAALYFESGSDEACFDRIYSVLFDRDQRSRLVREGEKRIQNFSWENTALKTFELYERFIK